MGHPSGQFAVVAPERWVSPALALLLLEHQLRGVVNLLRADPFSGQVLAQ